MLLTLSLAMGSSLRGLFRGRQDALTAAQNWRYLLAARGVIKLDDPAIGMRWLISPSRWGLGEQLLDVVKQLAR
jgi:hypothetical protein